MDQIFRNLGRPLLFLWKEGAFVIALSLLTASILYNVYVHTEAPGTTAMLDDFLLNMSDPVATLSKLVLLLLCFGAFYLLFVKSPLKFINNAFFNGLSLVFLGYLLYRISPLALYLLAGIGLILILYKYLVKGGDFNFDTPPGTFGESRFSRFKELEGKGMTEENGFILGRDPDSGAMIGFRGEGHILTVAKTGSGKGVGVVVPNLLNYNGSVVVIDPKGENFIRSVYARANLHKQEICLIDPFGEVHKQVERQLSRIQLIEASKHDFPNIAEIKSFYTGLLSRVAPPVFEVDGTLRQPSGDYYKGINPLEPITALAAAGNYQEVIDQGAVLANMIVVKTKEESDPHWNEKARMIIKNMIVFLVLHEMYADEPKNLVELRTLILEVFEDEEALTAFYNVCQQSKHAYYLKAMASEFKLMGAEEGKSVLSFVLRHLEFIGSPMAGNNLSRADCSLLDIKEKARSIYLVLPSNKIDTYSRLARIWIASIISAISISPELPKERILMLVDEMAQLGKMEPLMQAVSLLRGYGLNLWMFFQDIPQMESIYGANAWKTFSSNARVQQFFGVSDQTTAEYVSALAGMTTITTGTIGVPGGYNGKNATHSYTSQERKLVYPDQLFRTSLQLIFTDELYPIRARKIKFFNDGKFKTGMHFPFQLAPGYQSLF
ncbi:type IV secretory system conjugative DNA transfer family protein [Paraflavitalea pollutisoli]|uniref:type IV secretory system conjugative DNA transfer family protein n=1 Tax=Paraflavitalea pollutisoli TaxID=3034143 RepID=UPI0023ECE8C5|nr:type IV secretory system conjugative DNA transfer family protein [Paraflavitalea sp. H1-2-19X]